MQSLRDILRSSLRTSLNALTPLDRLAAAWPVAAGHAIAERSSIVRLESTPAGSIAIAEVQDPAWLPELRSNTPRLLADLARISGVALTDILFFAAEPGSRSGQPLQTAPPPRPATVPKSKPARTRPAQTTDRGT